MLAQVYHFILSAFAPLYTVIYQTNFFFIDFWSFIHFGNGFILMVFLMRKGSRHPIALLLALLFCYECVEMAFPYFAVHLFKPEIIPDQFTDVVIGLLGGLLGQRTIRMGPKKRRIPETERQSMKRNRHEPDLLIDFFISFGMSFLWVGSYGYEYNIAFYNSPGINWLAFLLWGVWLMLTIRMHRFFSRVASFSFALGLTWVTYFSLLLFYEYIGYYVLQIRLVTNEGPLMLGVIHGPPVLKAFYLVAGVCAVFLSLLVRKGRMPTPGDRSGRLHAEKFMQRSEIGD